MMQDRLITLAIHTYEKATVLKSILENEGIETTLQNVNLLQPVVSSGVRVRIHESDLPKALRIIENSDLADTPAEASANGTHTKPKVLVPVDFSAHSDQAIRVAFTLAASYGAEIVVLHSFISPSITSSFQLTGTLNFDEIEAEIADDEARLSIEEAAEKQLDRYARSLHDKIKAGTLPPVPFTTVLIDDVAEDAILSKAKEIHPLLIVMGTRGTGAKERDMIGSVTAEVLDTCRFPVFTVPDGLNLSCLKSTSSYVFHVVFFCSYEQHDLLALDLFYSLFPNAHFHITLLNCPTKKMPINTDDLGNGLKKYYEEHFPRFTFGVHHATCNDLESEFQQIDARRNVSLIAVPNKKRNMLARLFNPGLAHRLLFHAEVPMIVLPV